MFVFVTSACIVTYSHVHSSVYEDESTEKKKASSASLINSSASHPAVRYPFPPRVFIERFAAEIMSLLNQTRTKTKECQPGRRKAISHSEIESEPRQQRSTLRWQDKSRDSSHSTWLRLTWPRPAVKKKNLRHYLRATFIFIFHFITFMKRPGGGAAQNSPPEPGAVNSCVISQPGSPSTVCCCRPLSSPASRCRPGVDGAVEKMIVRHEEMARISFILSLSSESFQ